MVLGSTSRCPLAPGLGAALLLALVGFACIRTDCSADADEQLYLTHGLRLPIVRDDTQGASIRPFAAGGEAAAHVFVFTLTDCPISNRYAPRIVELAQAYASRGVRFHLVYPDSTESDAEVRTHLVDYGYRDVLTALRDPQHELVRLAGATVTPEACLFLPDGTLAYRGRIDDQHADFGKTRPRASEQDLARALDEVLAGRPVSVPRTEAVGCYIPEP